jgi:hypothetical protein
MVGSSDFSESLQSLEQYTLGTSENHESNSPIILTSMSVQQSLKLTEALQARGLDHKLVIYPGGEHSLNGFDAELENEVSAWWDAHRTHN